MMAEHGATTYKPTERVRRLRQEKFLTMDELSARSGVHVQTIIRVEKGQPAKASTIRKLAKALGVEPSELAEL